MDSAFVKLLDPTDGWQARRDPAQAGGWSVMENAIITDRDGLAVRPGTELFGAEDTTNGAVTSIFTTKTRNGTNVMLRASDTVLEYYNRKTSAWARLKSGFTSGQVFGFQDHSRGKVAGSIDNNTYVYFCNGIEPYQRWRNEAWDKTTVALAGGETAITVESTLTDTVFYSGTASSVTTTTIDIASADWFANQWNDGFCVLITSGAQSGQTRDITATTTTQITFGTIGSLSGTPTFEIRQFKFPTSGTVIVNTTTVAYTDIPSSTTLTVASAPAASNGSPVALVPEEFKSAPRGNIFAVVFTQMFLSGNPRFSTTLWRSKVDDATDFSFSSPRVAGEGDVIDIPDATPKINDVSVFEDKLIAGSESYIESIVFTQDANDLPNRTPVFRSSLAGPAGRAARMGDDVLFANKNKEITSLGRVMNKDVRPFRRDIGWDIKRAIKDFDFTSARTYTFKNYTVVACKETEDSATNDLVLVYDNNRSKWVGEWNVPAQCFTEYDGSLYFGSSASREVYKMFTLDTVQDKAGTPIGYGFRAATQWINKTRDNSHLQQFDCLKFAGYIKLNTTVTFRLYYDFETEPTHTWQWDPTITPTAVLDATQEQVMGVTYLGSTPLGVDLTNVEFGDYGEFRFLAYFRVPPTAHTYCKLQIETDGESQYLELTEIAANLIELKKIAEDYVLNSETSS